MQKSWSIREKIRNKFHRNETNRSTQNSKNSDRNSGAPQDANKKLLHGQLYLDIKEARNLPDMEKSFSKVLNKKDVTDAYVEAWLGGAKLLKTNVVNNELNPKWNDSYALEVCHFADNLKFKIQDLDHAYSEYIGFVKISIESLLDQNVVQGWFPILKANGKQNGSAELNVHIHFCPAKVQAKTYEVESYFPVRRNCLVTLYQDSHVLNAAQMPQFEPLFSHVKHNKNIANKDVTLRSCWKDLYYSIIDAKHIICITGWSVWYQLKLLRGEDRKIDNRSLGEILADKANNGVDVYVMIWYDVTGMMGTKCSETYYYFKNTKVHCASVPRETSVNHLSGITGNLFSKTSFSHHQKSVICDAPGRQNLRRLVAYVGGLDLTGGRYDTPNHELYATLHTDHKDDFHNGYVPTIKQSEGPREPWHDIHCKVEGQIAHDVFINFQERWSKQGRCFGSLPILDLDIIDPVVQDEDKQWCCQLFRSITSDSANFHRKKDRALDSKQGRVVEASIAKAYSQMIRNAEKFIYIENQYFYGSAYSWEKKALNNLKCHNTIPLEITQKIITKISANEQFRVYIVIPMCPEGDPSSMAMQEILFWQSNTIKMMYKKIGEALVENQSNTDPTDWLVFLCLGKRDAKEAFLEDLTPATDSMAKSIRSSLRFPIYVHSKMMIVDDVYAIIGSANINQRSLSGSRDTELAMGCWQPYFGSQNAYGDVHKFRMSLWAEHFRSIYPDFDNPENLSCMRKVKELALKNWEMYNGPPGSVTLGQILMYPLDIQKSGEVLTIEGVKSFPDFPEASKVMGQIAKGVPSGHLTS